MLIDTRLRPRRGLGLVYFGVARVDKQRPKNAES
jgi:hypothetical protein